MINVQQQKDKKQPWEHCCFCREETLYWFVPANVPCCRNCASVATEEDVPTRDSWVKRENIARKGTPGKYLEKICEE